MPYDPENKADVNKAKEKLQKTYKSVSDTAARQAIHIFNSIMDSSGDEGRAWAGVYSQMNDRLTKKASTDVVAARFLSAGLSEVGQIILDQMGGYRRLMLMLGVKQFISLPNGVKFMWPNRERSKGNMVQIILDPSDTYTVTFFNVGRGQAKKIKEIDNVYAEDLVRIFERQTGWYLRMGSDKTSGFDYAVETTWFSFVGNKTPFNRDVIAEINHTSIDWTEQPGDFDRSAPLRFIRADYSPPLTFQQEKLGQQREAVFSVQYPSDALYETKLAIAKLGKTLGFKVTWLPKYRKATDS